MSKRDARWAFRLEDWVGTRPVATFANARTPRVIADADRRRAEAVRAAAELAP